MSARNGVTERRTKFPLYRYEKLTIDPSRPRLVRNLRLIHLRPASDESTEINCALEVVNADETPSYDALSWCWGSEPLNQQITISTTNSKNIESRWAFYIPYTLDKALRVLRRRRRSRTLWVDLICINQEDKSERNEQVPLMRRIYGNASKVCIWLDDLYIPEEDMPRSKPNVNLDSDWDGSSDDEEKSWDLQIYHERKAKHQAKAIEDDQKAIDFIRKDVLRLWNFDELCKNQAKAEEWIALVSLMRKPWFSRRWVVQEIALAKDANLYTMKKKIRWRDFVDAVSLFVEVEDASHRLTEIMQHHEVYNLIPDFFEDLSEIGASMLVKATGSLFRGNADGKRDSQKSLEYLMSKLAVFDVTDPRDAVYALLAIAKDSTPLAADQRWSLKLFQRIVENDVDKQLAKKTFRVDYSMKIVDVFQDFVAFSIRRSMISDPERALDILCRPWAPRAREAQRVQAIGNATTQIAEEKLPTWIMGLDKAAFKLVNHPVAGRRMTRANSDPLVGIPDENRTYRAAESKWVDENVLKFKKCNKFYALFVLGFKLDTVGKTETFSQNGHIPWDWIEAANWTDPLNQSPPEDFWRTLVADRNHYGLNAPSFFERACHEAVKREMGKTIDTKKLMVEGRCSIVAAFLRRVRAVIWNRRLARCARMNRLCMMPRLTKSGDMICILHGCSVPVVLREHFKTDSELEDEIRCDEIERNKPREKAARKIAEAYRKNKAQREKQAAESSAPASPPMSPGNQAKKAARWEKIHKEIGEIIESEEAELQFKIKEAQATPKNDLRRRYFEFVGACYVHGMMNGEAIEEQNNYMDEHPTSDFMKRQPFELH